MTLKENIKQVLHNHLWAPITRPKIKDWEIRLSDFDLDQLTVAIMEEIEPPLKCNFEGHADEYCTVHKNSSIRSVCEVVN